MILASKINNIEISLQLMIPVKSCILRIDIQSGVWFRCTPDYWNI